MSPQRAALRALRYLWGASWFDRALAAAIVIPPYIIGWWGLALVPFLAGLMIWHDRRAND